MREKKICSLINGSSRISVNELSHRFGVSVETIRRDLSSLEKKGLIVRVHGGAISNKLKEAYPTQKHQSRYHLKQKKVLAQHATSLIKRGAIIGLDASITSRLIARCIPNIDCTVITNSSFVITELEDKKHINVICIGGNYSTKHKSFYGIMAMNNLEKFKLDISFLSCDGFDLNSGIWESNERDCQIKQSFLKVSQRVALIMDRSKISKRSLLKICNLDNIDHLISYADFSAEEQSKLTSCAVQYHQVAVN